MNARSSTIEPGQGSGDGFAATRFRPSDQAASRLAANALQSGAKELEPWRPALIAFYLLDCMPQKALNLRRGAPFDYLDMRAIEALQAAVRLAP